MSGKILVVDAVATNRIVLKVRLQAAYYQVLQAASVPEACDIAARERPDLILASAGLPAPPGKGLVAALRACDGGKGPPVMLLLPDDDPARRADALEGGADDVIARPVSEALLLARLRCLLRRQHAQHDYPLSSEAAQALGFADPQRGFRPRGRIALVTRPGRAACTAERLLSGHDGFGVVPVRAEAAAGLAGGPGAPDIYVLCIADPDAGDALRLMAELRAAPRTRHHPVIALLDPSAEHRAATALDMGASDTLLTGMDPREIALRIARLLDHKHSTDMLRRQLHNGLNAAILDPLTGVYNRRYALPYLRRLLGAAMAGRRSVALMVADLDHFKRVNDSFGHAAGDRVLTDVATRLCAALGKEGLVARIGGEEFLLAMPDVSRKQARRLADRLCQIVRDAPVRVPGRECPVPVTISIGVTMAEPDGLLSPCLDTLLEEADRALYRAKAQGRNTVTFCARNAA